MNLPKVALFAGVGALALAGIARAETPETHVLTIELPNGQVEHIRYTGDVAPAVTLEPIFAPTPTAMLADPFVVLRQISAEMDAQAAAMMQDVGKFMNHQGHHRHTQYIVANSEIFGFSPEQRAIVAAIARYLGKTRPEPMDRAMRLVPVEEQTHTVRAVVLLRLANALSQERATPPVKVRVRVFPKRVVLELVAPRGGAELEAWSLKKEAPYFREIFRRELFVEVA